MRKPQYGQKGKKLIAPDAGYASRGLTFKPAVAVRVDASMWGKRAVGLAGPNAALPDRRVKFQPSRKAQYEGGTFGAPCTLHLHHKGAAWEDGVKVGGEGPIVTKRWTVVKTSPR